MFDHFNFLAPIYDRAIPFSRLAEMLRIVNLPIMGTLLDAGGGTGRVACALSSYVGLAIVADFSSSNVFCGHRLQPDMEVATSKLCNQFE